MPFPHREDIDFPVGYAWLRFYDPTLPTIDDRTEKERRIDEGIARAMTAIKRDMNGVAPQESPPRAEGDLAYLSSRVDYSQTKLAEAMRRIRDLERLASGKPIIERGKKQSTFSDGGVEA